MSQNLLLPVGQSLPWYEFTTTLSGVRYVFEMQYSLRMDRWHLTLSSAAGQVLIAGIPVLIERDLLRQYTTVSGPPGALFALDQTGQGTEPGLKSFLTTHVMVYAT